jgi:hypothetical protein
VTDNGDGTSTVDCGEGGTFTTTAPADSCTVTDNGDGTSTVDCGEGGTFTSVAFSCFPGQTQCNGMVMEQCASDGSAFEAFVDCAAAGVTCVESFGACLTVRLVDGADDSEGRIEFLNVANGVWGTVCDDDFDENDNGATVVCRSLGFGAGEYVDPSDEGFGDGEDPQPIWLDDVICAGTESRIEECPSAPVGSENCSHSEDSGARCYDVCIPGTTRCMDNDTLETCNAAGDGFDAMDCGSGEICVGDPGNASCAAPPP